MFRSNSAKVASVLSWRRASEPALGVDGAVHNGEAHVEALEELHEPRPVHEFPREPVEPVDDDALDVALLDVREQLFESGALDARAALALVVKALADRGTSRATPSSE